MAEHDDPRADESIEHLDGFRLERLLRGGAPMRPEDERLVQFLETLRSPASPRELTGQDRYVGLFEEMSQLRARSAQAQGRPRSESRTRTSPTQRRHPLIMPARALAAAATFLVLGGGVAAALTGSLPPILQDAVHRSFGAPPAPRAHASSSPAAPDSRVTPTAGRSAQSLPHPGTGLPKVPTSGAPTGTQPATATASTPASSSSSAGPGPSPQSSAPGTSGSPGSSNTSSAAQDPKLVRDCKRYLDGKMPAGSAPYVHLVQLAGGESRLPAYCHAVVGD